jgi:hypothetical protein
MKKGLPEPPIWREFLIEVGILFGGGLVVAVGFILFVGIVTS